MVAGGSRIPAASSLAASARRKASACGDTWPPNVNEQPQSQKLKSPFASPYIP